MMTWVLSCKHCQYKPFENCQFSEKAITSLIHVMSAKFVINSEKFSDAQPLIS